MTNILKSKQSSSLNNDTWQSLRSNNLSWKLQWLNKYDEIWVLIERFLNTKRSYNTKRAYRYDIMDCMNSCHIQDIHDLFLYRLSDIQEWIYQHLQKHMKYENMTQSQYNDDTNNNNNNDKDIKWDETVINAKTINRKAYAISSFFDYLIKIFWYKQNPLCLYQPLKEMRNSNTDSLERGELIQLLEYSKSLIKKSNLSPKKRLIALRNYLMMCFLSMSLRRHEVVKIQRHHIKDISWVRCVVVKQKWWTYKTLPIPQRICQFLDAYKNMLLQSNWWLHYSYTSDDNIICDDKKRDDNDKKWWVSWDNIWDKVIKDNACNSVLIQWYIFMRQYHIERFYTMNSWWEKEHISDTYLYELVKRYCKKLTIHKNITPHSFRKAFIEIALNNNQNFINICNATWHTDVNLIKYYDTRDVVKNNAVISVLDWVL